MPIDPVPPSQLPKPTPHRGAKDDVVGPNGEQALTDDEGAAHAAAVGRGGDLVAALARPRRRLAHHRLVAGEAEVHVGLARGGAGQIVPGEALADVGLPAGAGGAAAGAGGAAVPPVAAAAAPSLAAAGVDHDLAAAGGDGERRAEGGDGRDLEQAEAEDLTEAGEVVHGGLTRGVRGDRKSTRLNSSH